MYMSQFSGILDSFAIDLLDRIAKDYDLDIKELKSKYLTGTVVEKEIILEKEKEKEPEKSTKSKKTVISEQDRKCEKITIKGTRCKYNKIADTCFCKIHTEKSDTGVEVEKKSKTKKNKKDKKGKKETPGHSHTLTEELADGEICRLCETHGDVSRPTLPDAEFEISELDETPNDIASRLKKILAEAEEEEHEESTVPISISLKELLEEEEEDEDAEDEPTEWEAPYKKRL
jgi:hypothetical protein